MVWEPRPWCYPADWSKDRNLILNCVIILPPSQTLEGWRNGDLGQNLRKTTVKGWGKAQEPGKMTE